MSNAINTTIECQKCGAKLGVNFGRCLGNGWPTCCGETMYLKRTRANIEKAVDDLMAPVAGILAKFSPTTKEGGDET